MSLKFNFRSAPWLTLVITSGWAMGAEPAARTLEPEPAPIAAEVEEKPTGTKSEPEGEPSPAKDEEATPESGDEEPDASDSSGGGGGGGGGTGGATVENAPARERSDSNGRFAWSLESSFWGASAGGGASSGGGRARGNSSGSATEAGAAVLGVRKSGGGSSSGRSSGGVSGGSLQLGGNTGGSTSGVTGGILTIDTGGNLFVGNPTLNNGGGAVLSGASLSAGNLMINSRFTQTIGDIPYASLSGLTKAGAGTLILGGVNSYTGVTMVSAGTLVVNRSLAGGLLVNGGSLNLANTFTGTNMLTLNSGNVQLGALSTLNFPSGAVLTLPDATTVSVPAGGSVTLPSGSSLSATGGLTTITQPGATVVDSSGNTITLPVGTSFGTVAGLSLTSTGGVMPMQSGSQMVGSMMVAGNSPGNLTLPLAMDSVGSLDLLDTNGGVGDLNITGSLLEVNPIDTLVGDFAGTSMSSAGGLSYYSFDVVAVPEPGSLAAVGGLWFLCWRRQRR
jgi:autotransporter-associated beta strand protein